MKANSLRAALLFSLSLVSAPLLAASLGTIDMNTEGVTLDLNSVERKGNVITVKWTVKNSSDKNHSMEFYLTGRTVTTYLVDEENGTKYYALTDKEGNVLATEHVFATSDTYGISEYINAGQSMKFWAKFPAPPPAVKSINILFTGGGEPFESIAITDKK